MEDVIYQVSDLTGNKRVEFIQQARAGLARLRDKDGLSLVMLKESRLTALESHAVWSLAYQRLVTLLRRDTMPTVEDLGDLAWLRTLDREDLTTFTAELYEALIAGLADEDVAAIDETVQAWRVTARQLADPLRRSVLLGPDGPAEYDEVEAPERP